MITGGGLGIDSARVVEEIKSRVLLSEIVGRHVRLKRSGRRLVGLCPFHQEKTPSFYVDDDKGLFHCFGCGKGGDVISFVMEIERVSFKEAVEELAKLAGVDLPDGWLGATKQERSLSERILEVNRIAAQFYHRLLIDDPSCEPARKYLQERDVPQEYWRKFGLGCAPDSWDALVLHLRSKGIKEDLAERAGLILRGQSGFYDRFRNRLMFPILARPKQVVGFSGRTLGDDPAKYMNTPETVVYHKSRVLFGFDRARDAIRANRRAYVVEGNFDVLRMHMYGFTETVAPCGTALTAEQVLMLKRLDASVILVFDGDEAGRKAAWRALPLLLANLVESKVVFLPTGEDPDSFLRKYGADALNALIEQAKPLFDAFVEQVATSYRGSPEGKARAVYEVASVLAEVQDLTVLEASIPHAAHILGISTDALHAAVRRERRKPRRERIEPPATQIQTTNNDIPKVELELLVAVAANQELIRQPEIQQRLESLELTERVRQILLAELQNQGALEEFLRSETPLAKTVRERLMSSALPSAEDVLFFISRIEERALERRLEELGARIREAERTGDDETLKTLLAERRVLFEKRQAMKNRFARRGADAEQNQER